MNFLFDLSKWQNFKCGLIKKKQPLGSEKSSLDKYMRKFIFNKYSVHTSSHNIFKSTTGYTLYRRCQISKSQYCKSYWILRIDIKEKSAHLYREFMCDHIASSIRSVDSKLKTDLINEILNKN